MNRLHALLTAVFVLVSLYSFSQNEKHLKKNLSVFVSEPFDKDATIYFERKNPQKHGWEYAGKKFEQAFATNGFKVGQPGSNHHYIFVLDYDYGYKISAYKMQYKNLKGEIFDETNRSHPIGTFSYMGRYENDDVAQGIALRLRNAK
ncbi:MAG TPA: hypothetical protein VNS58_20955 [Puia sp.]|nr:hypothetical protein [Puia sp.]